MVRGTRTEAAALAKDAGWAREVAVGMPRVAGLAHGTEGRICRFVELVCCEERRSSELRITPVSVGQWGDDGAFAEIRCRLSGR